MPAREKTKHGVGRGSRAGAGRRARSKSVPIWLARDAGWVREAPLTTMQKAWVRGAGLQGRRQEAPAAARAPTASIAGAVLGLGEARAGDPMDRPELALGLLPGVLPPGLYHLADERRGRRTGGRRLGSRRLSLPPLQVGQRRGGGPAQAAARCRPASARWRTVDGVWLGRDLINTPASDMGPQELEDAARQLAKRHGASVTSIVGDDLRGQELSDDPRRRPRQRPPAAADRSHLGHAPTAPRVTLVGKGICFDTGGLDIKPASAMLIMKKDMGGAAAALALAHMVMAAKLDVRLRVLIPAAENSVAGNAFRPGDVLTSRAGKTVEIGNTDAEGRLVLADALALADEERPDTLVSFATLTGAARVALGPELPPLYTDDDALRRRDRGGRQPGRRSGVAHAVLDRLRGQRSTAPVADMNNVSRGAVRRLGRRPRCSCAGSSSKPAALRTSTSTAGGPRPSRSGPRAARCRQRAPCSRCCAARAAR